MSGFDKKSHLSLFVDFELAVLGGATVDELCAALCCTSIAAPSPRYSRSKYEIRPVEL